MHLCDQEAVISFITGSPGIGKSVEVYAYAMRQASAHGQRVIYVHCSSSKYVNLVSSDVCGVQFGISKLRKGDTLPIEDFLESELEQKRVDLIVLDGQLGDVIRSIFFTMPSYPGVRLITCTSFQAFSFNTDQADASPPFENYIVDSWTLEEQRAAVRKKALVLDPTVTSVDEAYYYAGGSARMLQWSIKKIINVLKAKIKEVENLTLLTLVGNVVMGDSSKSAKNTLMSFVGGVSTVTSRYIVGEVWKTLSESEAKTLRGQLPNDPSWQGKIAELEVFATVERETAILFRDIDGGIETWPRWSNRGALQKFRDASDPCLLDPSVDWYTPSKFNEGGFDAIYRVRIVGGKVVAQKPRPSAFFNHPSFNPVLPSVHSQPLDAPGVIRVIQVTISSTHSCKLKNLIGYVRSMKVTSVDFVFVCRRTNFDTFQRPHPESPAISGRRRNDEHKMYKDLLAVLQKNWEAQSTDSIAPLAPPAITFRTVRLAIFCIVLVVTH